MSDSGFSKILDTCLSSIWAGEATIDDCLRMYPEHAEQLAPMLALAVEAHTSMQLPKPSQNFVKASRQRIYQRLSTRLQDSAERRVARKPAWRLKPAQVFLSLMLALSVLAVGAGVIRASAAALPGDALYGLKLGLERARLALSMNAAGDLKLLTRRADTRLEELQSLVEEGKDEGVGVVLEGYEGALTDLTDLATTTDPKTIPGSLEHVLERLAKHQEVLECVLDQVPPSAQPAIEHAMERSMHSQEVIQQLRQGGSPSDLAPGQERTPPGQGGMPPGQDRTPPPEPPTPTPTPEPPTPTATEAHTLHVYNLYEVKVTGNVKNWLPFIAVEIKRDDGQPITNATMSMYGRWTYAGGGPDYVSCTVAEPNNCRGHITTGATTATFTVTNVVGPYPYAPSENIENLIVVTYHE